MTTDWWIINGLTPWSAYQQYVIKNNAKRHRSAASIIRNILVLQRKLPNNSLGVPTHDLICAVVPQFFKHETSAFRVIGRLVKYNVIECTPEWIGNHKRTYYSVVDPFYSKISTQYPTDVLKKDNHETLTMGEINHLFIQAYAGRQVLERHGLTEEWIAECNVLASGPVIESGTNYGEYDDPGTVFEMLSHSDPGRYK